MENSPMFFVKIPCNVYINVWMYTLEHHLFPVKTGNGDTLSTETANEALSVTCFRYIKCWLKWPDGSQLSLYPLHHVRICSKSTCQEDILGWEQNENEMHILQEIRIKPRKRISDMYVSNPVDGSKVQMMPSMQISSKLSFWKEFAFELKRP